MAVQSVLDVNGETAKTALFTRVLVFNPENEEVKTFAYPVDTEEYKNAKDCKIGEITAVNDEQFLVIEQGKSVDGNMMNRVFLFDISEASDITDATVNDQALEYVTDAKYFADIKLGTKELFIDLRTEGWEIEKAEGMILFDDNSKLAIMNDNDFGLTTVVEDESLVADLGNYVYNAEDDSFTYTQKKAEPIIYVTSNDEASELWILDIAEALK